MKTPPPTSFKSYLFLLSSSVWSVGFEVPLETAQTYLQNDAKRIICTIDDHLTFQCAIMSYGDGRYFVNVNADLQKKLGKTAGDQLSVVIEPDTSKYGLPMPEELQVILDMDTVVDAVFHKLTPGKQRTLLHMIGKPKSTEVRIKKAMIITDYVKEVDGKLDFEELKLAFKQAKNR